MYQDIKLPDFDQIRQYERIANKEGSGITDKDLRGIWRFQYVWKNGKKDIDNISSSLLQVLSAKLELCKSEIHYENSNLEIRNSVQFGLFTIIFVGQACLKGNRPLLSFKFNSVYFKVGSLNLVTRKVKNINSKNSPFFSLIAIDKDQKWLCARGKGGGLAIWIKE